MFAPWAIIIPSAPDFGTSIIYLASSVSADGRTLLIRSNQKGGYSNVGLLDIATRKPTWVTDVQWDAAAGNFAPKGGRSPGGQLCPQGGGFPLSYKRRGPQKTPTPRRGPPAGGTRKFPRGAGGS